MKTTKNLFFLAAITAALLPAGCDNDDPDPINEEELITTVILTFTPTGGGDPAVFSFKDLDGVGGAAPVTVSDTLAAATAYTAGISLLNESVSPAGNIGDEVNEEGDAHQFFYQVSAGLDLVFSYGDQDVNGKPVGLKTTWTSGAAGSGTLTLILRHEPEKDAAGVADGDITNAAGETDVEVQWPVVIE